MSRSLQWRLGSLVACCRVGALNVEVGAWDLLKRITIVFITSTIVGLRSNNREGTQLCPENWIKDLLNMAPSIRTRPSFALSHSLIKKLP